ncbi:MAG: NUDIX domain-containing protein [Bacteroidales bacterium]|jgi:NAD+ diphosphatase|nr:NUDIX domain-containing protein [Bacteroidales bacterium]
MNSQFHPHSVFNYCPSCGQQSFEKDSFKSQKCLVCGFVLYTNASTAVAAIITNRKGEILLTKRAFEPAQGMFDLPGGFVDPGETAEKALIREVHEELNLIIESYSYFSSFPNEYVYGGLLYYTLDMVFECKVTSLEQIIPADDVADFVFLPISKDLIEGVGLMSIKNILRAYIK